jgi:hypothetical protein
VPSKKTPDREKAKKTPAKKAPSKKAGLSKPARTETAKGSTASAQPGNLIVIDSAKVGSAPREGEILKVIESGVSVRYQVKWADGNESLITPAAGTAHIVPT